MNEQGWRLRCFNRKAFEVIPGCSGDGDQDRDYCTYRKPTQLLFVSNGGSNYGLCEGDCDFNEDCDQSGPPLICAKRDGFDTDPFQGQLHTLLTHFEEI